MGHHILQNELKPRCNELLPRVQIEIRWLLQMKASVRRKLSAQSYSIPNTCLTQVFERD